MSPTHSSSLPSPDRPKAIQPPTDSWALSLEEERRRLYEDQEALRERERNLREYEARLRQLQATLDAGHSTNSPWPSPRSSSKPPFGEEASLPASWERLHRARALLEAEQAQVRDDRLTLREMETQIKRREQAVSAREESIAAREAQLTPQNAQHAPPKSCPPVNDTQKPASPIKRLSQIPFNLARSVLSPKD